MTAITETEAVHAAAQAHDYKLLGSFGDNIGSPVEAYQARRDTVVVSYDRTRSNVMRISRLRGSDYVALVDRTENPNAALADVLDVFA